MIQKLLHIFEQSPSEYISGEQISKTLGCSRTAVWKHIQTLRRQGYIFESAPRLGYRLIAKPRNFDIAKFKRLLETRAFGREIIFVEQTSSTQMLAHEYIASGAGEGTVILAEQQTQGKGRMGRSWFSPPGKGLWFTLILEPRISLQAASQLTYLSSIALCRTMKRFAGVHAVIKWPNDVLIQQKKVSGILLESNAEDDRLMYIACGIGINVNFDAEDFPAELKSKVTSLKLASGQMIDREAFLAFLLIELEQLYHLYLSQGFEPIRLLWETHSASLGQSMRIRAAHGVTQGTVAGMDENGALLLQLKNGEITKIFSGDVEYSS